MQSSESLGVLTLIFPSAPVVQGWTTACDWLEAPLLGHSPCHRFIESCPQGVLRTIRVVMQPESSGCFVVGYSFDLRFFFLSFYLYVFFPEFLCAVGPICYRYNGLNGQLMLVPACWSAEHTYPCLSTKTQQWYVTNV